MTDGIRLLARYADEYEARLAADLLEEHGIPAQLIREADAEDPERLGSPHPFRLYVRGDQAEDARAALGAYQPPVEG